MAQSSSQYTFSHRSVRGSTLMCHVHIEDVKLNTEFYEDGHPIGENASILIYTPGFVVPCHIPINILSRHEVTKELKDYIYVFL